MPDFKYRGIIRTGKMVRGIIEGKNKHEAVVKLKTAKIWPIELKVKKQKLVSESKKKVDYERLNKITKDVQRNKEKRNEVGTDIKTSKSILNKLTADVNFSKTVKSKDILTFTNSLYILKKARFNNIAAFEALYNSTENERLKDAIDDILIGIQAGSSINSIMERNHKIFPPLYINFVKVGEESGSLDIALKHARDYMESSIQLRKQIRSILLPKLILFIFLIFAMLIALLWGTPLIQNVYDMFNVNKELPKATQIAVVIANGIIKYWYIVLIAIASIFALIYSYIKTPIGRYRWDKFKIKAPIFGELVLNITTNKFLKAMLLNLRNGMRIQESLETSKTVTNNYYFLSLVEAGKNSLISGGSWIEPFKADKVFSGMVIEMLEIGMKTDLVEMMNKVEIYLQQEIDETIAKTVKRLPEISYVFIGIILVFFVLTVMVPLIDVYMGGFLFEAL